MSREKYVVQLTDDARESLQKFVRGGTSSAREVARARILLKADDGWTVHRIAEALDVSPGTVCRIKRRFCEVDYRAQWWIGLVLADLRSWTRKVRHT